MMLHSAKRLINILSVTMFLFIIEVISCTTDNNQATNHPQSSVENFDTFLYRFNNDSLFQISRVNFPLKIVLTADEGSSDEFRKVSVKQWRILKLMGDGKHQIIKKIQLGKNKINVQLTVEDTGIHIEHYFIMGKGKWRLNLIIDGSD